MRKLTAAILSMALLLGLAAFGGCGTPAGEPGPETFTARTTRNRDYPPDSVSLTAEQTSYPANTKEVTATWHNGTSETIAFGEPFTLQVWDGESWADAKPLGEMVFILPAYLVEPNERRSHAYPIASYYGTLQPGRYRIETSYSYVADWPTDELYADPDAYAEFEIK